MASAKLFRVIVPVSSINEAATYYSAVLEQSGMRISPGRHYFDCGGTILACFDPRADGDAWDATPNPDHVYFAVDDLEACHALEVRADVLENSGRARACRHTGPRRTLLPSSHHRSPLLFAKFFSIFCEYAVDISILPEYANRVKRKKTPVSAETEMLGGGDVHEHNTFEQPDAVATKRGTASVSGKVVQFTLPPSSVTRVTITLA